jgi:hypothetical protein
VNDLNEFGPVLCLFRKLTQLELIGKLAESAKDFLKNSAWHSPKGQPWAVLERRLLAPSGP